MPLVIKSSRDIWIIYLFVTYYNSMSVLYKNSFLFNIEIYYFNNDIIILLLWSRGVLDRQFGYTPDTCV